ncbi:unnamed protein product [Adineta ricciae]|uniref:Ig-like domain-containing protein n=3 Tax=Adineta ricciae TaxID=249248 RepID=A0A815AHT0_ADIRI|nr:unnamed protein product [Adineta ricciae]
MLVNSFFVCFFTIPWLVLGQLPYQHSGQYGPPVNNDMYQQQIQQSQLTMQQQQMQVPMHQQQSNQQQQQQQQPNQQQQQQPQLPIQQPYQMPQQEQQQQQHYQMSQQDHQQHQLPMHQQQQYYQGTMQGSSNQFLQGMQLPPLVNQFQQPTQDHPAAQGLSPPMGPSERYLVGNLSEPFSFQVAPPSVKVAHLSLNGYSLFIIGVGFSNRSKFNYDEETNRLTVLTLDRTTVGYYTAVDRNWQTFVNILSAINVSSLVIRNSHVSEDNNGSALVSCSVSIIRSRFKLTEPPASSNNPAIAPASSLPLQPKPSSNLAGTENLPRLDLFLSTRTPLTSSFPDTKVYNDSLNEQDLTRTIILRRPLTRADHNGTVQCQVESNNNVDVYLIKTVPIDIDYGPNLEAGALPIVTLDSEALKMIAIECQIEANPAPSYVWYEMPTNVSTGMMPYYGNQMPYGQNQYPLQPQGHIPPAGSNVFGTTRQIQRIFQNPGPHAMQCQAQSGGKTIKQQFNIMVHPSSNEMKGGSNGDGTQGKSYKVPMIIGLSIGGILLLLLIAIVIAAVIFLKRRKAGGIEQRASSAGKIHDDKFGGNAWNPRAPPPNNQGKKYGQDVLKGDSSSTSHLVESAENNSNNPPPIPSRPSPMLSTHSSYRHQTVPIAFSYQQASTLNGSCPPPPLRSYSPDQDDGEEIEISVHAMPLATNRSRTTTPFGSRKSLTESIQSLRSNQQSALSLPVKKRPQDPPPLPAPMVPKRDHQTPSPKSFEGKKDYQYHHYHNPTQIRTQPKRTPTTTIPLRDGPSDEEMEQLNSATEDAALLQKKFKFRVAAPPPSSKHNQAEPQHGRRMITPPPPQKIVVHQPSGMHQDEPPPSYHQISKPSAPATAFAYQEPTEV